jgi:hypothetical protein
MLSPVNKIAVKNFTDFESNPELLSGHFAETLNNILAVEPEFGSLETSFWLFKPCDTKQAATICI